MKSNLLSQNDTVRALAYTILGALALALGSASIGLLVNNFSPRSLPVLPVGPELAPAQKVSPTIPLPEGIKPITLDEAKKAFDEQAALFLDARPAADYAEAHLPGALNLPPARFEELFLDLADRIEEAPALLVYCTGEECSDSIEVAERLQETGDHTIYVMEAGWRAWVEAGYPTTTGPEP